MILSLGTDCTVNHGLQDYICETTVLKSVQDGDVQTAKWVLSHKARDRGYGDKIEFDGQLIGEVKIIIQGE